MTIRRELAEGERLTGVVLRLPEAGAVDGNRLTLNTADGVASIPATGRRGWTVLERELSRVRVGDTITVHFVGWREKHDGVRYRLVHVRVRLRPSGGFE
jgi:hypothetical protein